MPLALPRICLAICLLVILTAAWTVAAYVGGKVLPVLSNPPGMALATASALVLLALGIGGVALRRPWLTQAGGLGAGLIGGVILGSYALTGEDNVSELIQGPWLGREAADGSRTSLATALSILLLTASVLARRARPRLADICAGLALLITGVALLGYAYGAQDLHRITLFNTMALRTAVSLFGLAIAVVAADPSTGCASVLSHPSGHGGSEARRLLAIVVAAPLAGALLVRAVAAGQLGFAAAMAMLVTVFCAPLAWLALRDGRVRMQLDAERQKRVALQAELVSELERRLQEKVDELELQVRERERKELVQQRSQRSEAIGRLTRGIAHDFNNLLQALSGNIALLQRGLSADASLRRFADNAENALRKGVKLTGQLMAFSRTQRLAIRPIHLSEAIRLALEPVRHSLGPTVSVEVRQHGDLWALADAQQLELALFNLSMNARDAMPDGGTVRISSGPSDPQDPQDVRRYVSIWVTDDGVGMPQDVISRAGEPFFTTKPQDQAKGLGLAQVFGFARQCGGEVRIESAEGVGTSVEIALLASDPPAEEAVSEASLSALIAGQRGRKVAVIDDDPDVRAVIVQELGVTGYDVLEARDGPAGLALMASERPDVAVIDFMMPGMNGAETAKLARTRWPDLPIVFVSGYSDTLALEEIAGATLLRKPFGAPDLHRAVARAVASAGGNDPVAAVSEAP